MQQNNKTRQINEAMRQITNVIERARKKGCCQNIVKYIIQILKTILNEQNLETNTVACKYLTQDIKIFSSGNRALKSLTCVMLLYGPFSICLILTVPLTVKY